MPLPMFGYADEIKFYHMLPKNQSFFQIFFSGINIADF